MRAIDLQQLNVVAIAGGVGGAKLINGLAQHLKPENLYVIANTGDDFEHLGLWVSPDLDTIMYMLAGINNPKTGWGQIDESWTVMEALRKLDGPTWFSLGDRDLATNLLRTHWRRQGYPLSWITRELCQRLGVTVALTPMTDSVVQTRLHTNEGELAFQEYFVHQQCKPKVTHIEFSGAAEATISRETIRAVRMADIIIFAPSNPYLSIDPILALPGLGRIIQAASAPKIAVTPIIGGAAVKGPLDKLMQERDQECSPFGVAHYLRHTLTGFVLDIVDQIHQPRIQNLNLETLMINTLMKTRQDQAKLARSVIEFGLSLG